MSAMPTWLIRNDVSDQYPSSQKHSIRCALPLPRYKSHHHALPIQTPPRTKRVPVLMPVYNTVKRKPVTTLRRAECADEAIETPKKLHFLLLTLKEIRDTASTGGCTIIYYVRKCACRDHQRLRPSSIEEAPLCLPSTTSAELPK
jgi:hypothetical protein